MGSGFKDWAAGDVLTAADVDGYLMRQTVMTFADASARDTALSGVLDEGMVAYLEDVNALTVYNGSAWVAVIDSDVLTVDTANNRVGINDASPSYALDVTGDINASGALRIGGVGVGDYTDYSGSITFTNMTLGNGTVIAKYSQIGKFVHYWGSITLGSTTSIGTFAAISLPVNAVATATGSSFRGTTFYDQPGVQNSIGGMGLSTASLAYFQSWTASGSYVTAGGLASTVPFTWATGNFILWSMVYEAA